MQDLHNPVRHAVGDFRILKQIDDDAEKPENAARGDEPAGVKRARARFTFVFFLGGGFHKRADQPSGEHGAGGGYG